MKILGLRKKMKPAEFSLWYVKQDCTDVYYRILNKDLQTYPLRAVY